MLNSIKKKLARFVINRRLRKFKEVIHLNTLFIYAIRLRFRNLNEFKLNGHSEQDDKTTLDITNHILKIKQVDNLDSYEDKFDSFSLQDETLFKLMDAYEKIQNIINSGLEKPKVELNLNIEEPFIDEIEKKTARKIKSKLKKVIKKDVEDLIDRSTLKIDISLNELVTHFTLIGTLTFIGRYIYNKIFYSLHGIDINIFFGPSDYVFSAFDQIRFAITNGFLALVGVFYHLTELHENLGYFKANDVIEKRRRNIDLTAIVVALVCIALFFFNFKLAFKLVYIPIYVLILYFIDKYTSRYFAEPMRWLPFYCLHQIFYSILPITHLMTI